MPDTTLVALLAVMGRIERKLDTLIQALGEEIEEVGHTLDGDLLPGERDQNQSL